MKRLLQCLLICLGLLNFISCKKENATPGEKKMPFDHKSYLYVAHDEDQSLLRQKLLNLALTQKIKKEDEAKIEVGDEFKMLDDSYSLASNDKAEYQKMQGECAEIIISYKDHLEFYFVPTGIKTENALRQIGYEREVGDTVFWVREAPVTLEKKHTYYLMEATNDEIKNNDINYYEQTLSGEQLTNSSMSFKENQIIFLDFDISYYTKETAAVTKNGPVKACKYSRDVDIECTCNYNIENLTGGLIKTAWQKNDLGLFLKLNNKEYSLNNFDSSVLGNGHLQIKINAKNYGEKNISLSVLPWRVSSQQKTVAPYNKTSCLSISNETLDMTPVIRSNLKVIVKGRAFNF